ncbi:hypothetical protein BN130_2995 [Cronobacter malonaticus 507]|nr:hypothetical protein BN130_2995 [Cronobacter malonaticus 507]
MFALLIHLNQSLNITKRNNLSGIYLFFARLFLALKGGKFLKMRY